jgi:hypothetical protein
MPQLRILCCVKYSLVVVGYLKNCSKDFLKGIHLIHQKASITFLRPQMWAMI